MLPLPKAVGNLANLGRRVLLVRVEMATRIMLRHLVQQLRNAIPCSRRGASCILSCDWLRSRGRSEFRSAAPVSAKQNRNIARHLGIREVHKNCALGVGAICCRLLAVEDEARVQGTGRETIREPEDILRVASASLKL